MAGARVDRQTEIEIGGKPRSPRSFLGTDHLEWVRRLFVPLISRPVMQIEAEGPEVGDRELERDVCVAVLLQQRQQLQ